LDEDCDDRVVAFGLEVPMLEVAQPVVDRYLSPRRQPARLVDGVRCEVERGDDEALLGKPDAVPPLAVGDAQHAAARPYPRRGAHEEFVRRFAEQIIRNRVARIPGLAGIVEAGNW